MSMFFTSQLENDRQTVETSLFFFNVNFLKRNPFRKFDLGSWSEISTKNARSRLIKWYLVLQCEISAYISEISGLIMQDLYL